MFVGVLSVKVFIGIKKKNKLITGGHIMAHCWKDKAEFIEDEGGYNSEEWAEAFIHNGTCMLEAGHEGDHVFTPDNEITITFG